MLVTRRRLLTQLPLAGVAGGWVMGSGGGFPGSAEGGGAGAHNRNHRNNRYGIRLRPGYPYPPGWTERVRGRSWKTVGGALRAARGHRYPSQLFLIDDLETKPADAVTSQGGR